MTNPNPAAPLSITVERDDAAVLVMGRIYTDTRGRAAFRLVAVEDRPDGRVELWWEQVPHCPAGRHDRLSLSA